MKPYITKNNDADYALRVPADLIHVEDNSFEHYFLVTFTAANLNRLFKDANLDIVLPISEDNVFIDSLGVFKLNILHNNDPHIIKIWVIKEGN